MRGAYSKETSGYAVKTAHTISVKALARRDCKA